MGLERPMRGGHDPGWMHITPTTMPGLSAVETLPSQNSPMAAPGSPECWPGEGLISLLQEVSESWKSMPSLADLEMLDESQDINIQNREAEEKAEEPKPQKKRNFAESLLAICNTELERWKRDILISTHMRKDSVGTASRSWVSVSSGSVTSLEDSGGEKESKVHPPSASKKAYKWVAKTVLKSFRELIQRKGPDPPPPLTRGTKDSKIDPKEVFYGAMPIGVIIFNLYPKPGRQSPWVNQGLADYLGYMRSVVGRLLTTMRGIATLYESSNLEGAVRQFFQAICHRKASYSTRSIWIHADGSHVPMLQSVSIKYKPNGLPLNVTVFLQRISGIKVDFDEFDEYDDDESEDPETSQEAPQQ